MPGLTYKDELVRLSFESLDAASAIPAISIDHSTLQSMLPQNKKTSDAVTRLNRGEEITGWTIPGIGLQLEIDLEINERTGRNVLARLKSGASPDAPALIVGAHIDHLGRGQTSGSRARRDETGQIHFGADDNASGVAALIEIAQKLSAEHEAGTLKAHRDIIFAAWSGEELGLLGSSHFTNALAKRTGRKVISGKVSAYLNMDMVGRLDDELTLLGVGSSKVWKRQIERANVPVGIPLATSNETYLPTDATAFYLKGVPILHAFTGAHDDYSTPRDTPDKLNYPGPAKSCPADDGNSPHAGARNDGSRLHQTGKTPRQKRAPTAISRVPGHHPRLRVQRGQGRSNFRRDERRTGPNGWPARR